MKKYIQITDKVICIKDNQCVSDQGYYIDYYIKKGEILTVFGHDSGLLSLSTDPTGQVRTIAIQENFINIQDWRDIQLNKLLNENDMC